MPQSSDPIFAARGSMTELETGQYFAPKFDAEGLIPAIVTDTKTGNVVMFAWMNREALTLTLRTRIAHFWSRSRKTQWMKGEESGNVLNVESVRTDCDQDVVLVAVTIAGGGVACHTGAHSCFYRTIDLASAAPGSGLNSAPGPVKLQTKG
jgi:phosphoribosyl-AMP cyclohydrolase